MLGLLYVRIIIIIAKLIFILLNSSNLKYSDFQNQYVIILIHCIKYWDKVNTLELQGAMRPKFYQTLLRKGSLHSLPYDALGQTS